MPFHSYFFFDIELSIKSLSVAELSAAKESFLLFVSQEKNVRIQAYATLGFKAGNRFVLVVNAAKPEALQLFLRDALHTTLGTHLRVSYTLFGMSRTSQYRHAEAAVEMDWDLDHKYLVVYPFTKTIEWHLLPLEERRAIMKGHVDVGREHSEKIAQRLLYSYGIDDHEFIVSYYMNDLEAFVQLVIDMRATESRRHTKNDLPIFTGIHMPLAEALEML
jgi:chlorite dismutase